MKVIIAGGRDFDDYKLLCRYVDKILSRQNNVEIVSGTAKGADRLGERYANEHGLPIKRFPAQWNVYGKSAGYIRNVEMADYGDALIVFWDGMSNGTQHMMDAAEERQLPMRTIRYM